MVDLVGRLRVQVADRVVADGGQVDDRVEALEVLDLEITDVTRERLNLGNLVPERARGEEVGVDADDVMAGGLDDRDEDGADVAVVAGDEYAHEHLFAGCVQSEQTEERPRGLRGRRLTASGRSPSEPRSASARRPGEQRVVGPPACTLPPGGRWWDRAAHVLRALPDNPPPDLACTPDSWPHHTPGPRLWSRRSRVRVPSLTLRRRPFPSAGPPCLLTPTVRAASRPRDLGGRYCAGDVAGEH